MYSKRYKETTPKISRKTKNYSKAAMPLASTIGSIIKKYPDKFQKVDLEADFSNFGKDAQMLLIQHIKKELRLSKTASSQGFVVALKEKVFTMEKCVVYDMSREIEIDGDEKRKMCRVKWASDLTHIRVYAKEKPLKCVSLDDFSCDEDERVKIMGNKYEQL